MSALQDQYTYASTQETTCCVCQKLKHTPFRDSSLGGYVCITCISATIKNIKILLRQALEELESYRNEISSLTGSKLDKSDAQIAIEKIGMGRIKEIECEADRYCAIRAGLVYIEPNNGEGPTYEIYVAATERGVYCRTPQEFDAAIDAAIKNLKGNDVPTP